MRAHLVAKPATIEPGLRQSIGSNSHPVVKNAVTEVEPSLGALSDQGAEEVLSWVRSRFGNRATFACSFGAEDMVILDMLSKLAQGDGGDIRVFTLDTGRLFPETYELMQEAHDRYRVPIQVVGPDTAELEEMLSRHGPNLFYASVDNRKACCNVRKVHPLSRALRGAEAWVVGLRRDQSAERSAVEKIGRDKSQGGIWKVCPLADWSWEDVLAYVKANDVPINRLHAQGFPSIGCAPCTRAVQPGEDPRSGRWWWETGVKECGLHPAGHAASSARSSPA
jgi:phosphoadenosine phosphosulfate reductase